MWPCTPKDLNLDFSLPRCTCCVLGNVLSLITNSKDMNLDSTESQGRDRVCLVCCCILSARDFVQHVGPAVTICGLKEGVKVRSLPWLMGRDLASILWASSPSSGHVLLLYLCTIILGTFLQPRKLDSRQDIIGNTPVLQSRYPRPGILRPRPAEAALGLPEERTLG